MSVAGHLKMKGVREMFMSKNRELLMQLRAEIETLKTALIVMDPKVSTSADAYEGLRKQVAVSASSRQAHLVQLALFSRALTRGASNEALGNLVDEWMQQAGLVAVTDPDPDLYEILEGDKGFGALEVLSPAYLDPQNGRLVAMGQARWVPPVEQPPTESESIVQKETSEEAIA
jgi:hypothetical protein